MAELYDFQKQAVANLLSGKRFIISSTGSGKSAVSMVWARLKCERTGKDKVLVVTTASKAKTLDEQGRNDFEAEADEWNGEAWRKNMIVNFTVISWHKFKAWTFEHADDLADWVVIMDEVHRGAAGVSSGFGRAFLNMTAKNPDWAGFTATPGDTWLKFYPYFTACRLNKNKTTFMNRYARVQTYKGYPEIVGWNNEDELKRMWAQISYAPDTAKVMAELPEQTHKTVLFKAPTEYKKILKTRTNSEGEFLESSGALCSELRRVCFTKAKKEWLKDFVEGLESGCVFYYSFIKTGDELEQIIQKALPKGAKVWRIDGKHHEIPTAETMGKHDMVLCQWQSGSEALNLQFLHYWVCAEPCYAYSTFLQAKGRIRRLGQHSPQFYYRLWTAKTIEDDIYDCLANKGEFAEKNWCIENNITIKEEE